MFVVTLPRSAQKNPAVFACKAERAGADVLEIRTDLTPRVKKFASVLPILIAVREEKAERLTRELRPEYVDCDVRAPRPDPSLRLLREQRGEGRARAKIILSLHDYKKTPTLSELKIIIERMRKQKPWAVKIATQIVQYNDLVTLTDLQLWLKKKKIRSIVLGMGDKAHLTRVLSPLEHALTYTFVDGTVPAAEGQLSLSFYRNVPKTRHPQIFGIIGGPQIEHSLSPNLYNALFRKYKIDALFTMFPTDDFHRTLRELEPLKIAGFCVTAPFKREAMTIASERDPLVEKLGAANTLVRTPIPKPLPPRGEGAMPQFSKQSSPLPSGEGLGVRVGWIAFNTDVAGIVHGYPFLATCNSVAILGAGGAAAAAIEAVRTLNPAVRISVFVRDPKKALAALLQFGVSILPITELKNGEADAVICAITPDVPILLPHAEKGAIAIDLRYANVTKFMEKAKKNGFRVYDGRAMLIHQALRQFEHFTGLKFTQSDAAFLQSVVHAE